MPNQEAEDDPHSLLSKLRMVCDNIISNTNPLMSQDFIHSSFNDAKARSKSTDSIQRWSKETMKVIHAKCKPLFRAVGIKFTKYSECSSDFLLTGVNSEATVIFQLFHWACVSKTCEESIRELLSKEPTAPQRTKTSIQRTHTWLKCFVINVQNSIRYCTNLIMTTNHEDYKNIDPSIMSHFTHACFTSDIVHWSSVVFSSFGINPCDISIFNEGNVGTITKTIGISVHPFLKQNMSGLMTITFKSFLVTGPQRKRLDQFPETFSDLEHLNGNTQDKDRTFNIMQFLYSFKDITDFTDYMCGNDRDGGKAMISPVSDTTPTSTNVTKKSNDRSELEMLQLMIPTLKNLHQIPTLSATNVNEEKKIRNITSRLFTKKNNTENGGMLWIFLVAFSRCVNYLLEMAKTQGTKLSKIEGVLIERTFRALDLTMSKNPGKHTYDKLFEKLSLKDGLFENEEFVIALVSGKSSMVPLLMLYLKPNDEGYDLDKTNSKVKNKVPKFNIKDEENGKNSNRRRKRKNTDRGHSIRQKSQC